MKLSISISAMNGNTFLTLSEESATIPFKKIICTEDLLGILKQEWTNPLLKKDKNGLLDKSSDNQRMVAIYFYLAPQTTSIMLMNQWFIDTGCNETYAAYLSELVYFSRFDKKTDPYSSTSSTFKSNFIQLESLLKSISNSIKIRFDFGLNSIRTDKSIFNLTNLEESYYVIEDHNCIIIGFSINYTVFVELMSGYNPNLLQPLCKLLPLEDRDIFTVGQIFSSNADIEEILTPSYFYGIEFFGINKSGKLLKYDYADKCLQSSFNIHTVMSFVLNDTTMIPLYIKFLK